MCRCASSLTCRYARALSRCSPCRDRSLCRRTRWSSSTTAPTAPRRCTSRRTTAPAPVGPTISPSARAASSPDRDDLGLAARDADGVADRLADEHGSERRHERDRTLARIGLVLADDAEGLPAPVLALHR